MFLDIGNIDPFEYVTIASVCSALYRSKFMPDHSIAVVDNEPKTEVHSHESISWLKFMNGGEVNMPGIGRVDGFCEKTNTVYEYQGCYWHGCKKCYKRNVMNKNNSIDMRKLRDDTHKKNSLIREKYELVEVWGCDILNDKEFKEFDKPQYITPLNQHGAFFGGRTEVFRLKFDENWEYNEVMHSGDYNSLYPSVNSFGEYPLGHHEVIQSPKEYDPKWFGTVKCKVHPSRGLYIPMLSHRAHSKLLFGLCSKCMENLQKTPCTHCKEERALIGTWWHVELNKALELGYEIPETTKFTTSNRRQKICFVTT